jgi:PRTRC genetic system protein A
MTTDLDRLFASAVACHLATPAQPLREPAPPITWLVAANGIFKRGCTPQLDLLIPVLDQELPIPGLTRLLPSVRWSTVCTRLPGGLLAPILDHAQRAGRQVSGNLALPIEQQYLIVHADGKLRVRVPVQDSSATRIRYALPEDATILLDLHSHHQMAAYFSATDDQDDTGLSVSCVIGKIFTAPTIRCRLNVWGHRYNVPALTIFDHLGDFQDGYQEHERHCHAVIGA